MVAPSLVLCGHRAAVRVLLPLAPARLLSVCDDGWACAWHAGSGRCIARARLACRPSGAAAAVPGGSTVCVAVRGDASGPRLALVDPATAAQVGTCALSSAQPLCASGALTADDACGGGAARAPLALHVGAAAALGVTRNGTLLSWRLRSAPVAGAGALAPVEPAGPGEPGDAQAALAHALRGGLVGAAFSADGTWLLCVGARGWALLRRAGAPGAPRYAPARLGAGAGAAALAGGLLAAGAPGAGGAPRVLLWARSGEAWAPPAAQGPPAAARPALEACAELGGRERVLPPLGAGACVALLCAGPAVLARASAHPGACGGAGDTAVGAARWPGGAPAGGGAPLECWLSWVWRAAGSGDAAGAAGEPALGRTTACALAGGDALAPALLATVRRCAPAFGALGAEAAPAAAALAAPLCCIHRCVLPCARDGRSRSRNTHG